MDTDIDTRDRWPGTPVRSTLWLGDRRLSYLDYGGPGRPVLALHGHFGEGRQFARLAVALAPAWRLIAPDQRGHGESDRPRDYSRAGYVGDAVALLDHLGLDALAVVGHSLGGANAYQLAAAQPDRVKALVIEDIGAAIHDDLSFALQWPHRAPSRQELIAGLGRFAPYLVDAIRSFPDGWGLAFRPADMLISQGALNGDHWTDWLATTCPALVLHGSHSVVLTARHAEEMVTRRPHTSLVELPAGHVIHDDQPTGFATAVRQFLDAT